MNKNIEFIEKLKIFEEKIKDKNYSDVFEKYQFGECASLATYLYILNNQEGTKLEISVNDSWSEDYPSHHYIYKSIDDKYYDINGEFTNIYELIEISPIFSAYQIDQDLIEIIEVDFYVNNKLKEITNEVIKEIIPNFILNEFKESNNEFINLETEYSKNKNNMEMEKQIWKWR